MEGVQKPLTASSAVTPGVTYEIKLVVADQGDNAWDSAIFIEGGSFNIGGDLGVDRLIVDGNQGALEHPLLWMQTSPFLELHLSGSKMGQ